MNITKIIIFIRNEKIYFEELKKIRKEKNKKNLKERNFN